jgi:hypothetical protein
MRGSRVPLPGGRGGVAAHETGKDEAAGPPIDRLRIDCNGVDVIISIEVRPAAPKPP